MREDTNLVTGPARRLSARHKKSVLVAITILVCAVLVVLIVGGWYVHSHRYIPGRVTFQEFEPTYMPGGKSVTDKYLLSVYTPSGDPLRYTELALEFSGAHSLMYQRVLTDKEQRSLDTSCAAKNVQNTTCMRSTTSGGQPYVLFTVSGADVVASQEIDWSRDGTLLLVRLQGGGKQGYSQTDIERMIDGYRPTHYEGLPVRTADHSSGI